jgi:GTP-sensing pleiotropic transcriptional regulator CodY
LGARVVDIVHDAIGSARAHINVAIRQLPAAGLIEAGGTLAAELGTR